MPKADLNKLQRIETRILYAGFTLEVFTTELVHQKVQDLFLKEYPIDKIRATLGVLTAYKLVTQTIGDDDLVAHYRLTKDGRGLVSEMRMAAQDVNSPHHLLIKPSNSPNISISA